MKSARIKTLLYTLLVTMVAMAEAPATSSSADQKAQTEPSVAYTILVARPVEVTSRGLKTQWLTAVLEEYCHLRLDGREEIETVPVDTLAMRFASYGDLTRPIRDKEYFATAKKLGASFVLFHKYEAIDKGTDVQYYAELYSIDGGEPLLAVEKTYPLPAFGMEMDDCMHRIFKAIGLASTMRSADFFRTAVVGTEARSLKTIGEILEYERYKDGPDYQRAGRKYSGVVRSDLDMKLAHWLAGQAFVKAEEYGEAIDHLSRFQMSVPSFGPAYGALCTAHLLNENFEKAVSVAESAREDDFQSMQLLVSQLRALQELNRKNDAYAVSLKILDDYGAEPHSLLFVAQWRNREGRFAEALKHAEKLLQITPSNGRANLEKARSLVGLEKPDKAMMPLTQATVLLPGEPEAHAMLGDIHFDRKEYPKAAEHYQEALVAWSGDLEYSLKAAEAYQRAGNDKAALKVMLAIKGTHGGDRRVNEKIGLLQYTLKDTAGAKVHLEKCLRGTVENSHVFLSLGKIYTAEDNYLKAIRMYEQAMPLVEDKNSCRIALAKLYLEKGEPNNAVTQLEKIVAENEKYPEVYRYLGDAWGDAGEPEKALSYYRKQRDVSGDNVYVQRRIALLTFEAGELRSARKEGLRLVTVDPDNAEAHYRLAVIHLKEKNAGQAERSLKKAQKLGEADQDIYYQLGTGYAALERYHEAESAYERCVQKNPRRLEAWLGLSQMRLKAGKDSAAAGTYVHIASFGNEEHHELLLKAAKLFEKNGHAEQAKKAYNLYLGKGRPDQEANIRLARLEFRDKNYDAILLLLGNPKIKQSLSPADNMILAESYFATKNYREALPLLERAVNEKTDLANALELAAVAAEKVGDLEKAIEMYEEYLDLDKTRRHSDYSYRVAQLYQKLGDTSAAKKWYADNMKAYPRDMRNYESLATMCAQEEDWDCARKTLEKAVVSKQAGAELHRMLADIYQRLNLKDKAIERYKIYLSSAGNDSSAWLSVGKLHYTKREYAEAVEPLKKAHAVMPKHFETARMLGDAYMKTGKVHEAVKAYKTARELSSSDKRVIAALAACYRTLGEKNDLINSLREWRFLDPGNLDVQADLGRALLSVHNTTEGTKILEAVSSKRPDDVSIHRLLAKTYEATGNERGRLGHLEAALKREENDASLNYQMGRFHLAKGQSAKAEKYFQRAVELNPDAVQARFELGRLLRSAGKTKDAYAHMAKVAGKESYEAEHLVLFSELAYQMGKRDEAMDAVTRAVGLDSTNVAALTWAGFLYKEIHKTPMAKRLLLKGITVNQSCSYCYEYLGDAQIYEGAYELAAQSYEKALATRAYSEETSVKLAKAVLLSGYPEKAAQLFEKILSMNPRNDEALYWLSNAYLEMGLVPQAEKLPAKLKVKQKTGWVHLAQGEVYEAQGKVDAALISFSVASRLMPEEPRTLAATGRMNLVKEEFEEAVMNFGKALGQDPHNPQYLVNLGEAYEGLGDNESALQFYTEVIRTNPHYARAFYLAARTRSKEGKHVEAIKMLQDGLERKPDDPRIAMALGHEYRATAQYEKAIEFYEKAAEDGSAEFIEGYRHIGTIFLNKLKNEKKAKRYFNKYLKAGGKSEKVKKMVLNMN